MIRFTAPTRAAIAAAVTETLDLLSSLDMPALPGEPNAHHTLRQQALIALAADSRWTHAWPNDAELAEIDRAIAAMVEVRHVNGYRPAGV